MIDKVAALNDIIEDARAERSSMTSYKRIKRAAKALALNEYETQKLLYLLSYYGGDNKPLPWLAKYIYKE